jgi:hypothetical protein
MDHSPGSSYWKLRASASERDLYLSERATGGFTHVSLHRDGRWHIKVVDPNRDQPFWINYERPAELGSGLTLAMSLVAPAAWGRGAPSDKDVVWTDAGTDEDVELRFDVFLEDPPRDDPTSWPGRDRMGTSLVGRVRAGDGTTASVVVSKGPGLAGEIRQAGAMTAAEVDRIRSNLERATDPRVALYATTAEGAILIRHGFMDRSSFSGAAAAFRDRAATTEQVSGP